MVKTHRRMACTSSDGDGGLLAAAVVVVLLVLVVVPLPSWMEECKKLENSSGTRLEQFR